MSNRNIEGMSKIPGNKYRLKMNLGSGFNSEPENISNLNYASGGDHSVGPSIRKSVQNKKPRQPLPFSQKSSILPSGESFD